jgi:hypothetical protein
MSILNAFVMLHTQHLNLHLRDMAHHSGCAHCHLRQEFGDCYNQQSHSAENVASTAWLQQLVTLHIPSHIPCAGNFCSYGTMMRHGSGHYTGMTVC